MIFQSSFELPFHAPVEADGTLPINQQLESSLEMPTTCFSRDSKSGALHHLAGDTNMVLLHFGYEQVDSDHESPWW